jgi:hypothetical protein
MGVVISTYLLCCIKTMYEGSVHLANIFNPEFTIQFDVFSYVLPFISFVLDHAIKRVTNQTNPEHGAFVFLKLCAVVYYLGVYVMSLEMKGSPDNHVHAVFLQSTINLIAFPVLSCLYAYALYKTKLNF